MSMKIQVIDPHGFCAGVKGALARARALIESEGGRVWCLHELVHNELVVGELRGRGMVFVESLDEVPDGATVLFSAHGVSPAVRREAERRGLKVVDATCPFVKRVHSAASAFAQKGLPVVVIGKADHAEVKGIVGEIESVRVGLGSDRVGLGSDRVGLRSDRVGLRSDSVGLGSDRVDCRVINSIEAAKTLIDSNLTLNDPNSTLKDPKSPLSDPKSSLKSPRIGVVSQTTMNADEVAAIVAELKRHCEVETTAEVCRATKERQDAVKAFDGDALLVLGSANSSNTRRLCEVAGCRTFRAGTLDEVRALDFTGVERLGVTSGASTPEDFFNEVVSYLGGLT